MEKKKFNEFYERFLKLPRWKKFRNKAFNYYGRKCFICGVKKYLLVHHINYKRLSIEKLEDVLILCVNCHNHIHKYAKINKLKISEATIDILGLYGMGMIYSAKKRKYRRIKERKDNYYQRKCEGEIKFFCPECHLIVMVPKMNANLRKRCPKCRLEKMKEIAKIHYLIKRSIKLNSAPCKGW